MNSTRLVQLLHRSQGRRIALVEEPRLRLLDSHESIFDLAQAAIAGHRRLNDLLRENLSGEAIDYDAVYNGQSEWSLLPAFDHSHQAHRCLVTGTGLTHKAVPPKIANPCTRQASKATA